MDRLRREAALRRRMARVPRNTILNTRRLRSDSDYIRQLDFLIEHQETRLAQTRSYTAKCRKELEDASKEVRKLERLEEIRRDQYGADMNSLIQKENDEIASNIGRTRQGAPT